MTGRWCERCRVFHKGLMKKYMHVTVAFTCMECKRPIERNEPYLEHNRNPICKDCLGIE